MKKVHLVIIDPQVDFCDPNGALYVKGAEKDMERLGAMIENISDKIDDIHVTLDSHNPVHCAHPIFWKDKQGRHPNPFTLITVSDVESGVWTTTRPSLYKHALNYVKQLEKNGRYVCCIWPPHCLIGTPGHCIFPALRKGLDKWTDQFAIVDYITKGSSMLTEHYSAVVADVVDPNDPSTGINASFLTTLNEADIILLAGEAKSHCLANTVRDCINYFNDDSFVKKLVLLEDATSNVAGFEAMGDQFIQEAVAKGMVLSNTNNPL